MQRSVLERRTFGVDTGGTFTDCVALGTGEPELEKLSSTPAAPARAVLEGLARLAPAAGRSARDHVVHGTTVALNALLTGRTARAALVTGLGFEDLLEIGRQDRPDIYDLEPAPAPELVPRELRFGVRQRSWPDPADPERPLVTHSTPSAAECAALAARVSAAGAESAAVCLLHAYADPRIEADLARALARTGLPVTTSAGLLREHREVERFSTAVVNAVLVPLMRDYLGPLAAALAPARLSILQSSGGTLPAARAAEEPVRVILSGPAGGVVGAERAALQAGFERLVGLDMGGTSTDVSFHDAHAEALASPVDPRRIAGHAVAVPTLDIHTIGCGGGSLVEVGPGGVLAVGPRSAGADPGPVCYGKSDALTVTDAHVLLGHVATGAFLGGRLELDREGVERAFAALARRLGVRPREAAQAVLDVARAAMRRAIGVMTMQRGQDPARLPLVAFGGAGGLHAAALAASLGMPAALVPRFPGALSALGMACADPLAERALSPLAPLASWPRARRARAFAELDRENAAELAQAGIARRAVRFTHQADLRYRGQSFELCLPETADLDAAFERAHEKLYGYRLEGRAIELVCLRSRARVPAALARPPAPRPRALPAAAVRTTRLASFGAKPLKTPVIEREALAPGVRFAGPALVEEFSGTTLVPPGWRASVSAGGHLLLERER
jgi:N-methylhydantoinase A